MKNPFRNIRWRTLPHRLAKGSFRVTFLLLGILFVAVVLVDLYCEVQGLPTWAVDMIQGELARRGVRCEFRQMRVGLLSAITVEDATVVGTRDGLDIILRADRIKARVGLRALLSRQPFIHTLDISSASLNCEGADRTALLPYITEFSAELRPQTGGAYALNARGLYEGVNVRLSGRLRNAEALWRRRADPSATEDRLPQLLETITRNLRQCRFGAGDASLEATVDADAANWQEYAVIGNWNISNLMLHGTLAQTCKGQFAVSPRQLVFRDVMVRLNREEQFFGKVVVEPRNRRFWAEIEGQCTPGTAFLMADLDEPEWVQRFGVAMPVSFKAVLHPAPWDDRSKWHVELSCEASGFALRDLPLKRFQAQISLQDGVVRIPAFSVDVAADRTGEKVSGKATIWPAEGQIALDAQATLDWRQRSRQLGIRLPAPLLRLNTGGMPPQISLTIDRSPYLWTQWQGKATVRTDEIAYAGKSGGNLRADVRFGGDTLQVENLELALGSPGTSLTGRLDIRLPAPDRREIGVGYDLVAHNRNGASSTELAAFAGDVVWNPERETISARGEGTTRLARTFRSLGPALGLPDHEQLRILQCTTDPVHLRLTLPECRGDFRNWRLNLDVQGKGILYREQRFKEVAASLSIAPGEVTLTGLQGITADDETFKLNLALAFNPFSVTVTDGELHGDPGLIETFIVGHQPRQNYRRIWRGFSWDSAHRPRFEVPYLVYRQDGRSGEWQFEMRGTGEAEEITFQGVRAKHLTLAAKINLPGTVEVSDVVFVTDETTVKGNVKVSTDGVPSCDFRFAAEEGGCDPRVVVRMIQPDLEEYLGTMEFAHNSQVTCVGSFFLAKEPRLNLAGTVQTPSWHWGKVDLTDVTAKWGVRDTEIRWDIAKATCCGGTVASTGVYDTVTRIGSLAIEGEGASLNAVITGFGLGEAKPEHEAKVAVSGRVRFLRDWVGRPLQLSGAGRVDISEGDLWRVPVLTQLGDLLDLPLLRRLSRSGTVGLGRISSLRADLAFDGERVAVPNLFTDGTVVSLSGSGEYSWRTDRIEFDVIGETFRRVGFVSWVTTPLSWVFSARLSGTPKDYKWRMNNALKRAILGEDDTEKRRLGNP